MTWGFLGDGLRPRSNATLWRAARTCLATSALICACGGTTDGGDGGAGGSRAGSAASHGGSVGSGASGGTSGSMHQAGSGAAGKGTPASGAGGNDAGGNDAGGNDAGGNDAGGNGAGGNGGAGTSGSAGASGGKAGAGGGGGSGGANACDSSKTCCPTAKCACPFPIGDGLSNAISDLEAGSTHFKPGNNALAAGYWDFSKDASMGTTVPFGTAALMPLDGGANGTTKALHVIGSNLTGWGAALAAVLSNGCPFDASKYGGISFYAKGTSNVLEGSNKLLVQVGTPEYIPLSSGGSCNDLAGDPHCYARPRVLIGLTDNWKQYVIAWQDLQAAPFVDPLPFGPSRVRDIVFMADGPSKAAGPATSFDVWIDQLAFVALGTKSSL